MNKTQHVKLPKWLSFVNLIIVIIVAGLIILLNSMSNTRLGALSDEYKNILINSVVISVQHSSVTNGMDSSAVALINYLNNVHEKKIGLYDEEYNVAFIGCPDITELFHKNIRSIVFLTSESDSGIIDLEDGGIAHFRWIPVLDESKNYLLIYVVDSSHFDYSFILLIGNLILLAVFILIFKTIIVDNMILNKLLQNIMALKDRHNK